MLPNEELSGVTGLLHLKVSKVESRKSCNAHDDVANDQDGERSVYKFVREPKLLGLSQYLFYLLAWIFFAFFNFLFLYLLPVSLLQVFYRQN